MVVAQRLRDISELLAIAVGSDTVNSMGVSVVRQWTYGIQFN